MLHYARRALLAFFALSTFGLLATPAVGAAAPAAQHNDSSTVTVLQTGSGICVDDQGHMQSGDVVIEQYCGYGKTSRWRIAYRGGKAQIQLDPAHKLCIVRSGISILAKLGRCGKPAWLDYERRGSGRIFRYPNGRYLTYPGLGPHGYPLAGFALRWRLKPGAYSVFFAVRVRTR